MAGGEQLAEYVSTNDDGTKTVRLQYPFEYGPDTVSEVVVRRMKARDIRGIANVGGVELMEKVCGLTPEQADRIDLVDFDRIQGVMQGFLPPGLLAGG